MPGKIEKLITPLFHRFFVIRDDGSQRQKLAAQFANGDILEIGCAGKPNSLLRGTKLIGFDFVEPESNLPPNYTGFVRGDVRDLTLFFTPNSFDTIVALEVIEHLPDHCAFFSALARLIRPNGKVILSTPNPYYFSTFVANVFFKNGFSASSRGGGTAEGRNITLGPYYGHIHLHLPRIMNLIAFERGLILVKLSASTGWNIPFLAANLMYVYERQIEGEIQRCGE